MRGCKDGSLKGRRDGKVLEGGKDGTIDVYEVGRMLRSAEGQRDEITVGKTVGLLLGSLNDGERLGEVDG